jgi:hypothetical protein
MSGIKNWEMAPQAMAFQIMSWVWRSPFRTDLRNYLSSQTNKRFMGGF